MNESNIIGNDCLQIIYQIKRWKSRRRFSYRPDAETTNEDFL